MPVAPGRPFLRDVTLREAFSSDLASYLVGLVYLFMVACFLSLLVYAGWFGGPAPKESPGEIFLGFVVISAGVLAFLRYRARRVTELLKTGEVIEAEVVRGFAYQFFAQLLLRYTVAGRAVQAHLWLPNTKGPRELTRAKNVSVSVPPGRTRGAVIRDLYAP